MITFNPAKALDTGATISEAMVTNVMVNPVTLKLNGTISAYFDTAHQIAHKPMKVYPINISITSEQLTSNIISFLEAAAIEKYDELKGGVQS